MRPSNLRPIKPPWQRSRAAALVDSAQGGVVGPGAVVTPASPDSLIREDARTDGSLLLAAPDITR